MKLNNVMEIEVMESVIKEKNSEPINISFMNDLACGANNIYTNFPLRLAYLLWILRGANDLASLKFYSNVFDDFSDDGTSLRGAYGPRLRYWVGPDDLQEAINKNKNLNEDDYEDLSEFVKPQGIDQINAVYNDLKFGMTETAMQIFDPSLDFAKTNNVPDLHRVAFFVNGTSLNMVMDYMTAPVNTYMVNDVWAFMVIQDILAAFLEMRPEMVYVNMTRIEYDDMSYLYPQPNMVDNIERYRDMLFCSTAPFGTVSNVVAFWEECVRLVEFERHMRMQITENSFTNSQVSVSMMSETLVDAYLSKFSVKLLADIGKALLISTIIKNADDHNRYKEFVNSLYNDVNVTFKMELINYCMYCGASEYGFSLV